MESSFVIIKKYIAQNVRQYKTLMIKLTHNFNISWTLLTKDKLISVEI